MAPFALTGPVDYMGAALVFLMGVAWARAAEIDGRYALARHPWLWGLAGAGWTFLCRFGWGHSQTRVLLDQVVVALAMMAVLELHDRRRTRDAARREADRAARQAESESTG